MYNLRLYFPPPVLSGGGVPACSDSSPRDSHRESEDRQAGVGVSRRNRLIPPLLLPPCFARGEKTIVLFLILCSVIFFPRIVFAATLSTEALSDVTGERATVAVTLNSEDEDVNAIEGTLTFPEDRWTFQEIRTGNSIVSLWIQEPSSPTCSDGVCRILWSGIIPGGFSGRHGIVFSIELSARRAGSSRFEIHNARVLLNDGSGSPATLRLAAAEIVAVGKSAEPLSPLISLDRTAPEPFTPEISRTPLAFDNQWFVSFNARDRETGVAYYEVREGSGEYVRAENPYLLKDQTLRSRVVVRAVDYAGNVREAAAIRAQPGAPIVWSNWHLLAAVGAAIVAGTAYFLRRRLIEVI